jgi:chromosome segregation ATPase
MMLKPEQIEALKAVLPESVHAELTEESTIETVKELTGRVYVDKDVAEKERKSEVGKALGSIETKLKRILGDEAKGKTAAELAAMAEEAYQAKLTELDEARKGSGADVEKLRTEAAEAKKAKADLEKMLEQANAEKAEALQKVEAAENEKLSAIEQYKLEQAINAEWEGLNFADNVLPYTKKGLWMTEIEGKYTFKLENGKKLVYDMEGNIVKNGTSHMEAKDLFAKVAEPLLKKNGAAGGAGTANAADTSQWKTAAQKKHLETIERIKRGGR